MLSYNKRENVAGNALDDVVSAAMVRDLIQWAKSDVLLAPLLGSAEGDNIGVYLVGHSRGGKISVLEAIDDDRVKAVTLLDPVDNTVYAPLGEGFPSAVRAMRGKETGEGGGMLSRTRTPPLCVIGGTVRRRVRAAGEQLRGLFEGSAEEQLGRGGPRRALSVPGLAVVRAARGVRGRHRRGRAGEGGEPGAHGGARGEHLSRRESRARV